MRKMYAVWTYMSGGWAVCLVPELVEVDVDVEMEMDEEMVWEMAVDMDRELRNISPRFICTIILHAYPVSGFWIGFPWQLQIVGN